MTTHLLPCLWLSMLECIFFCAYFGTLCYFGSTHSEVEEDNISGSDLRSSSPIHVLHGQCWVSSRYGTYILLLVCMSQLMRASKTKPFCHHGVIWYCWVGQMLWSQFASHLFANRIKECLLKWYIQHVLWFQCFTRWIEKIWNPP